MLYLHQIFRELVLAPDHPSPTLVSRQNIQSAYQAYLSGNMPEDHPRYKGKPEEPEKPEAIEEVKLLPAPPEPLVESDSDFDGCF